MHSIILLLTATVVAISPFDISSRSSIQSAASTIAQNMMAFYNGDQPGQVPGLLPGGLACDPNNPTIYCWWESGAMWGSLINYWQYTGDTQYNERVVQALQFQRGPEKNFNPPNQTKGLGIDDQVFWAFSALDAVESNFPESSNPDDPSWLALAQAVFNFQTSYWDTETCKGGYRWQVYSFNGGYNLKNAISNGGNFQMSARLAYITGNQSYGEWAERVWEWMEQSMLIAKQSDRLWYVWDSTDANNNCTTADHIVWSYNYAMLLSGATYMYNFTDGDALWENRATTLLASSYEIFCPANRGGGNVLWEHSCEDQKICNQDQKSFKAYLSRAMAVTSLLVPSLAGSIVPKLQASAQGAAAQCSGPSNACGMQWYSSTYDGSTGAGQDMAALAVMGANLINSSMIPLTLRTGARSKSDPTAGVTPGGELPRSFIKPITTADKVGAGVLTVLASFLIVGGAWWLIA